MYTFFMASSHSICIRRATKLDIPQITDIFNYYVATSVLTFQVNPVARDYLVTRMESAEAQGLPYLVAVLPHSLHDGDDATATTKKRDGERIVGYAYASGYRNFMEGYKHTVEISLFAHPNFRSQGIGSQLIKALMATLRAVGNDGDAHPRIREVLACMSIDTCAEDGKQGEGLREWYEKKGFREVGRMENLGWKFDRWIGVIFLQMSLRSSEDMCGDA
jgi:phosphinothricin acetyltransferase